MKPQEILKKAMSNRQTISFKYRRLGNHCEEKIDLARVIFISTDNFGRDRIAVDLMAEKRLTKMHYFDVNSISSVKILKA